MAEPIEIPVAMSLQVLAPKEGVDDQPTIARIVMEKEGMPFKFVFEMVDVVFVQKFATIIADTALEMSQNRNNEKYANMHEIEVDAHADAAELGYETPAGVTEQVAAIVGAGAPSNPAPASGESDTNGTDANG